MAVTRSLHTILRRIGDLFGGGRVPRQARLYCVGMPRSGTHSVAAIFDRSIRARHEPQLRVTMRTVLEHHEGRLPTDALRQHLRERDRRLRLDVDASHVNAFLIDALQAEFADARFLLTMRDCYSWLDSAMNHTRNSRQWSRIDRRYLAFWFGPNAHDYSPHDAFLGPLGLPSVDCHLAAWRRHNEVALAAAPADRLLVVPTGELAARLTEIADFAGIARERIAPGFRAHGVARATHGLLDRVDPGYLEERVAAQCGALMRRFFPGIRSRRDVVGAGSS